jgi:hypothetical protein
MNRSRKSASAGKKSAVGQERREIYAGVWRAIKHAAEQGCWLEVIALCESVIADRLEARLAHVGCQSAASRTIRTANQSAKLLLDLNSLSEDEKELLRRVQPWSRLRNSAVHELAKVIEGTSATWNARQKETEEVAKQGINIARATSRWVRKVNSPINLRAPKERI